MEDEPENRFDDPEAEWTIVSNDVMIVRRYCPEIGEYLLDLIPVGEPTASVVLPPDEEENE